jgi:hypothetical protein
MQYVLIYFHDYLKLKTMIFNFFFLKGREHWSLGVKSTFQKKIKLYRFDIVYVDIFLLPPFQNIRCFRFMKQIYLDTL